MSYEPGRVALLDYGGDGIWHERLILAHVEGDEFYVCSPDFDLFIEELSRRNQDLEGLRVVPRGGGLPPGLVRDAIYGFAGLTDDARRDLLAEGRDLARTERLARGLPAAGDGLFVGAPGAPGPGAALPVDADAPTLAPREGL